MDEDLQHPRYAPYKGFPVNPLTRFAQAVRCERVKQDAKWGGPEHDKHHDPKDWYGLIVIHLEKGFVDVDGYPCAGADYYEQLVRVAALAEAAGEDYDRKIGASEYDNPPVECDAGCRRYKQKGQRYCRECRATIDGKPIPSEVAAQEQSQEADRKILDDLLVASNELQIAERHWLEIENERTAHPAVIKGITRESNGFWHRDLMEKRRLVESLKRVVLKTSALRLSETEVLL